MFLISAEKDNKVNEWKKRRHTKIAKKPKAA